MFLISTCDIWKLNEFTSYPTVFAFYVAVTLPVSLEEKNLSQHP